MKIEKMESIPPKSSPFQYDAYHMGTGIADNVCIMHKTHSNEKAYYIIIVNTETGERSKVIL